MNNALDGFFLSSSRRDAGDGRVALCLLRAILFLMVYFVTEITLNPQELIFLDNYVKYGQANSLGCHDLRSE